MQSRRALQCGDNAGKVNRNERRQSDEDVESAPRISSSLFRSFSLAPSNWNDETSTGAPESLSRESNREPTPRYNYSLSCSILLGGADRARASTDKTYDYSEARPTDREITFPGQRRVDNIAETMFP